MTDRAKDDLLPWVANQTSTEDEKRDVDAYVAEDPDARLELEFLEQLRRGVKAASADASPGELGLARLRQRIEQEKRTNIEPSSTIRWWQAAAIAATLLVAVQAVFLFGPDDQDGRLTTAGGPGHDGPVIQVTFVGEASEAAIRTMLLELGLGIIEGPSAAGVYRLSAGPDAASEESLSALVSQMKARSNLVTHAELEPPP